MPQPEDPVRPPTDMPIADLLKRWPTLAQVFIAYRLACIGCDFTKFHTLEDAARIYPDRAEAFLEALEERFETSSL